MSNHTNKQNCYMGNCLPVSRNPSHGGHDGAQELQQITSEVRETPLIQYPIDDTMPVKFWVYEKNRRSKYQSKPLRPEDERNALKFLNRHLPLWDQIEIPQPSAVVPDTTPNSRLRLFPEAHLSLPPRCSTRRERQQAFKPNGKPKKTTTTKASAKKPLRRARSLNWVQMEDKEEENVKMEDLEDDLPVLIVPDLVVTRPDGETRRLQDPNAYVSGK